MRPVCVDFFCKRLAAGGNGKDSAVSCVCPTCAQDGAANLDLLDTILNECQSVCSPDQLASVEQAQFALRTIVRPHYETAEFQKHLVRNCDGSTHCLVHLNSDPSHSVGKSSDKEYPFRQLCYDEAGNVVQHETSCVPCLELDRLGYECKQIILKLPVYCSVTGSGSGIGGNSGTGSSSGTVVGRGTGSGASSGAGSSSGSGAGSGTGSGASSGAGSSSGTVVGSGTGSGTSSGAGSSNEAGISSGTDSGIGSGAGRSTITENASGNVTPERKEQLLEMVRFIFSSDGIFRWLGHLVRTTSKAMDWSELCSNLKADECAKLKDYSSKFLPVHTVEQHVGVSMVCCCCAAF